MKGVQFIERIDEYNAWLRGNKTGNSIILLSQQSYANLSQYFQRQRGFALFLDSTQLGVFNQKNVLFAASKKEAIF